MSLPSVNTRNSTILATLCYVQQDQCTLMMHRIKKKNDIHQGKWNGLGGKLLPGETPEECVKREVAEESGLIISKPQLVGILTFPLFDGEADWYVFAYVAKTFTGTLTECGEGVLRWISNSELLNLNLWEGDTYFLKWILENQFFSGKFVYRDGSLIDRSAVLYGVGRLEPDS